MNYMEGVIHAWRDLYIKCMSAWHKSYITCMYESYDSRMSAWHDSYNTCMESYVRDATRTLYVCVRDMTHKLHSRSNTCVTWLIYYMYGVIQAWHDSYITRTESHERHTFIYMHTIYNFSVSVCCSVLQCVAVCCSECVAVRYNESGRVGHPLWGATYIYEHV